MRDDMGDSINPCALAKAFNANAWLHEKTEDPHRNDLNDQQEFDSVDMNYITLEDIITEDNTKPFLCRFERHLTEWAEANVTQPVLMNWVDAMRHQYDMMKGLEDAVVEYATVRNHSCLHKEWKDDWEAVMKHNAGDDDSEEDEEGPHAELPSN